MKLPAVYTNGFREIQLFTWYNICIYVIVRVCAKSYIKILLFTFKLRLPIIVQVARYSNITSGL